MANWFRVCVRFNPQSSDCRVIDWCTKVNLDRETEDDVFARAEATLAQIQARGFGPDRHRTSVDCDYAISIMTAFPTEQQGEDFDRSVFAGLG